MSSSQIDPRGPRFGAWVTTFVLATILILSDNPTLAGLLLTVQAVVFALGSRGLSPYQQVFKKVVRPRLGPPTHTEDAAPPRFAQTVGLGFAALGAISFLGNATVAGQVFTGFAFVAALLNAAIGLCLGCEVYLLSKRVTTKRVTTKRITTRGATT